MANRFPSPFEAETPPGAEGWEDLYTYSPLRVILGEGVE